MGNSVSQQKDDMRRDEAALESLMKSMQELKERRDDVARRVFIEEDEGSKRLAQVQEWFSKVESLES
ncbi:unnamed protein product [Thlaspi arvense]|uniref:Uncharacterized protein n=1 Tax=Thlaspi arvense TaxID=13288 RepID=A0AAU9RBI0_THLAR|nr:unnamed protein product [Thlaspi arvense]